MNALNISATLNLLRLISQPNLCLPQCTISTFAQIPVPLDDAFVDKRGQKRTDIKAVILDKDNCFATPHTNYVHESYQVWKQQLFSLSKPTPPPSMKAFLKVKTIRFYPNPYTIFLSRSKRQREADGYYLL